MSAPGASGLGPTGLGVGRLAATRRAVWRGLALPLLCLALGLGLGLGPGRALGQTALAAPAQPSAVFVGQERDARDIVSSPDGRLIVTADRIRITVWDAQRRIELRTLAPSGEPDIRAIALAPDGRRLVVGDLKAGLVVWDLESGRPLPGSQAGSVVGMQLSADGTRLATFDSLGKVTLREWPSLQVVQEFAAHSFTRALAVAPGGRWVATGSSDSGRLQVWDGQTGQRLADLRAHGERIEVLRVSPDGQTLVSGAGDARVIAWDMREPARPAQLHSHSTGSRPEDVAISTDGATYWVSTSGPTLTQRAVATGALVREAARLSSARSLGWLGRGEALLAKRWPGGLHVIDPATGQEQPGIRAASAAVRAMAVDEASGRVAAVAAGHAIAVWSLADGRLQTTLKGHTDTVLSLAFSGDGRLFSTGEDRTHRAWPRDGGAARVIGTRGRMDNLDTLAVTLDGQRLATGGFDREVRWWDTASGSRQTRWSTVEPVSGVKGGFVKSMATLQGGQGLLTLHPEPGAVFRWRTADGEALWAYEQPTREFLGKPERQRLDALAVSRDEQWVAAGAWDGEVYWWRADAAALRGRLAMQGLRSVVSALAFSPDGRQLLSGHWDGRLVWWDRDAAKPLAELRGHQGRVTGAWVLADGRRAVTSADDGSWRLWDLAQGREIAAHYTDGRGAWLVVLPSGHYMASGEDAERWVLVRHGPGLFDVSDIGAYRERFHRPDRVLAALALQPLPAQLADIATVPPAPGVRLVDTPARIGGDELMLQVRLTDAGGGVGELRVFVNGTVVAQAQGRDLGVAANAAPGELRRIPLKLAPGEHELQVVAFNAEGSMSSPPAVARVSADYTAVRKPRLHALVVGIEQFDNPRLQLRYAAADARAMAALLAQRAAPLFEQVNVELRVAPAETGREPLLAALARYRNLDPGDAFVLFVASHGVMVDAEADRREFVLLTSNVGSLSEAALRSAGIRQSELRAAVAGIPAAKKAMFFDTCHSGALGEAMAAPLTRGLEEDTAVKLLSSAVGSTVLSASTSAQQAIEGHEGHGIFTWALLQALSGKGDAARKGYVSTLDLAAFVEQEVPRIAEQVYRRKQYPLLHTAGQSFPLVSSRP